MTDVNQTPVRRTTARVVPVNADGQVLLLQGHDPARPESPYWFTIGGAIEPGETLEQAAVRELREETGIEYAEGSLGAPFHRGHHAFTFDGVDYLSDSTFFAVRLDHTEFSFEGLEEGEIITDARWWHPHDLEHAAVSNLSLPQLMRQAIAHVTGEAR